MPKRTFNLRRNHAIEGNVWLMKMTMDELVEYQNDHVISNVIPTGEELEVRVVSLILKYHL